MPKYPGSCQTISRSITRAVQRGITVKVARKLAETRIPTEFGTFALHLYRNGSNEDHVAFVLAAFPNGMTCSPGCIRSASRGRSWGRCGVTAQRNSAWR